PRRRGAGCGRRGRRTPPSPIRGEPRARPRRRRGRASRPSLLHPRSYPPRSRARGRRLSPSRRGKSPQPLASRAIRRGGARAGGPRAFGLVGRRAPGPRHGGSGDVGAPDDPSRRAERIHPDAGGAVRARGALCWKRHRACPSRGRYRLSLGRDLRMDRPRRMATRRALRAQRAGRGWNARIAGAARCPGCRAGIARGGSMRGGVGKAVAAVAAAGVFLVWALTPAARAQAPPARARGAWIEQRTADRDTTGLARALLHDRSLAARAAAARALGLIQERASVSALIEALHDGSATVRRQAAFSLGLMGDSTAAPALALRWEREPDLGARKAMVAALGMIGAHGSVPTISRALSARLEPERWTAALAAARIRDHTLTSPLSARAGDAHPEMRWRVAYALGRIGD